MHNLFLGTSKYVFQLWRGRGILTDRILEDMQLKMDLIIPPCNIGRIPTKIGAKFAGFTAEQWMWWTILYPTYILRGQIEEPHYSLWCLYSKACSILCYYNLHERDLLQADELIEKFCKLFRMTHGEEKVMPNMHMHCHLKDCMLDVGPLHSFWCFSFERYNGILENMQTSWKSPEVQLIHKFTDLQSIFSIGVTSMDAIPQKMKDFILGVRCFSSPLVVIVDGLQQLNYEKNLLCMPKDISALKMDFQELVKPG